MFEKNNVIIKLSFIFLKVYVTVADSGHPFSKPYGFLASKT